MVKIFLYLFLFLTMAVLPKAHAQQLYVWAHDGLTMRDGPSKKAKKLKTLLYGTPVKYSTLYHSASDDSILVVPAFNKAEVGQCKTFYLKGTWRKVMAGQDSGYVFDAFLSGMPPFKEKQCKDDEENGYGISCWLRGCLKIFIKSWITESEFSLLSYSFCRPISEYWLTES